MAIFVRRWANVGEAQWFCRGDREWIEFAERLKHTPCPHCRFLCPHCNEMLATVNPKNNLAHCFCCKKNLNNIDLLLTLDDDFRAAVTLLERWLNRYQAQQAKKKAPTSQGRK